MAFGSVATASEQWTDESLLEFRHANFYAVAIRRNDISGKTM